MKSAVTRIFLPAAILASAWLSGVPGAWADSYSFGATQGAVAPRPMEQAPATAPGAGQPSNYSFGATQTGSFIKDAGPNDTPANAQSATGGLPGQAGQPQNFSWGASNPTSQPSATEGQTGGNSSGAQDPGEAGTRPAGTRRGKGIASGKRQHKP